MSFELLLFRTGLVGLLFLVTEIYATQLKYRPARTTDLSGIAKLLCATFEEIPEWNVLKLKLAEDGYKKQLDYRMEKLVKAGAKHALIVVVPDTNGDGDVAGFMELGTMPSPIPVTVEWNGCMTETRPEMPYLANVAVGTKYRRQKIGSKLVQLAIRISEKWSDPDDIDPALYLSVDKDNAAAVSMYDKLDFVRIIDETDKSMIPNKDNERKLRRKPRLYFRKLLETTGERQEAPPE